MRRARDKLRLFILLNLAVIQATASSWTKIAPGIEYQDLNRHAISQWSHIHVFRIDLNHNELHLIMANSLSNNHAFAHEFAHYAHGLIAINGGFFDQEYHPLGLRINQQQEHNPLKYISWWGVFYVKDRIPHIKSVKDFSQDNQIDFAVQSGPRLLINGQIPSLKPGYAERSALGITSTNKVIILVTENNPVSTTWLAEHMKQRPLNCVNALNLDGGSSSQLYAKIGSFQLNARSFASVSDAIVVKPIKAP